jgi:tRNA(Arg) A34 adenosine deaminase TadA
MIEKDFLRMAIDQARKSVDQGGFPAGAVVVKDGEVIGEGVSLGYLHNDPIEHAETIAIRNACLKIGSSDLGGAVLYESLEACNMCFSVANWANISRIVAAARKTPEMIKKGYYEGNMSSQQLNEQNSRKIEIDFIPGFEDESLALVSEWEEKQV